jgi:tight adherence protein C
MLIWLSILLAGLFATLLVAHILSPVTRNATRGDQDGLPVPWRLAWPWIVAFVPICNRSLSWRSRRRIEASLAQAALSDQLKPGHVAAAQWFAALIVAAASVAALWIVDAISLRHGLMVCLGAAPLGAIWPRHWLAKRGRRRSRRIDRELPFILDMTMLCVQAGLNLQGALQQAAQYGPAGPLRDELQIALSEMRTGASRAQALKSLAERTNVASLKTLVSSLSQADLLGMNLGPILSTQAVQCRADRFQRAERLAMEAPVKMLFPLIACIFPCTFVVIGFPIAVSVMELKE